MALTMERSGIIGGPDDRLLKRAQRLAAAAQAVEGLDLKSIADTYQREAGGSVIEAGTVASAALNAALRASLSGGGSANEAVEKEVRTAGRRKGREVRSEEFRKARADEEGPAGDAARAEAAAAVEARVAKRVAGRDERIIEDAATRRALREERMSMVQSRRALSEARARIQQPGRKLPNTSDSTDSFVSMGMAPDKAIDDPLLRRAKNLVSGAQSIVSQLDEQNRVLAQRAASLAPAPPPRPPKQPPSPSSPSFAKAWTSKGLSDEQEDALVAKARELLVDYKPKSGKEKLLARGQTPTGTRSSTPKREAPPQPACTGVIEETKRGTRTRF